MKTSENAPRSRGRTSSAAASSERSGWEESSRVMRSESLVAPRLCPSSPSAAISAASSAVLVRLPLCPRATEPPPRMDRNDGWAFSQVQEPVVE